MSTQELAFACQTLEDKLREVDTQLERMRAALSNEIRCAEHTAESHINEERRNRAQHLACLLTQIRDDKYDLF